METQQLCALNDSVYFFQEEELRKEGDAKNYHLNEDLHLCVEVFSTPADGHSRIAHALQELEKFLVPDSVSFIGLSLHFHRICLNGSVRYYAIWNNL